MSLCIKASSDLVFNNPIISGYSLFPVYAIGHKDMSQQTFWFQCETKNQFWDILFVPYVYSLCTENPCCICLLFIPRIRLLLICPLKVFHLYIYLDSNYLGSCYFAAQYPLSLPKGPLNFIIGIASPFHTSIQGHLIHGRPILCSLSVLRELSFHLGRDSLTRSFLLSFLYGGPAS